MRRTRILAAVGATAALGLAVAPAAGASSSASGPHTRTLTTGVLAPFQIAAGHDRVYVADGFTATVSKVNRDGSLTTVASTGAAPGTSEVAGLAMSRDGRTLAWTTTDHTTGEASLKVTTNGKTRTLASTSAFEARRNPDGRITYGIVNPTQCQKEAFAKLPPDAGAPVTYQGIVESHPYAVTQLGRDWVVADAAANDLLRVTPSGEVSVLAVLPPQPTRITTAMAASVGLDDCVVGARYKFEPVPTDVEVGSDGMLYVTTLPGGPEDASFGARGSVYKVNPMTGNATQLATGFAGATNLAITPSGKIFVTELFAGRVSTVSKGMPKPYLTLPGALSVEYGNGNVYAGTMAQFDESGNPTGPGTVVKIS